MFVSGFASFVDSLEDPLMLMTEDRTDCLGDLTSIDETGALGQESQAVGALQKDLFDSLTCSPLLVSLSTLMETVLMTIGVLPEELLESECEAVSFLKIVSMRDRPDCSCIWSGSSKCIRGWCEYAGD